MRQTHLRISQVLPVLSIGISQNHGTYCTLLHRANTSPGTCAIDCHCFPVLAWGLGARSFLSCIRGPSLRHHGEYCIVVAIFSETMEHGVDASTFHTGNTDRTVLSIMALQPRSPWRNNHQAQHRDGTKRQNLGLGGTGKEWLTTSAEQRPD